MEDTIFILEKTIIGVKQGSKIEIKIKIGKPTPDESDTWGCPFLMTGIHNIKREIFGVDAWQCMMLAIRLAKELLTGFIDEGNELYCYIDEPEGSLPFKIEEQFY